MNWQGIFGNRIVQILLICLVIFGICILCGIGFHFSVGSEGITGGVTRGLSNR